MQGHYTNQYGTKKANDPEWFWSRVVKSDRCWLWTGTRLSPKAKVVYGQCRWSGKIVYAHRVAYELGHGSSPGSLCVLHSCDNGLCVRPDHLFLGTKGDNNRDRARKGRTKLGDRKGDKHPNAKLTETDVREIRTAHARGERTIDIASSYPQTSLGNLYTIVNRQSWKHVG